MTKLLKKAFEEGSSFEVRPHSRVSPAVRGTARSHPEACPPELSQASLAYSSTSRTAPSLTTARRMVPSSAKPFFSSTRAEAGLLV